jgi:hypothetical protein
LLDGMETSIKWPVARSVLPALALTLLGIGLASCGKFAKPQRPAWRDQAEAACLASGQVRNSPQITIREQPLEGAGTCGMNRPLKVHAFAGGAVTLTSAATLACPVVPKTDVWLNSVVQPAAMNTLGAQVIEIRAGSYSCRAMNNGSGTARRSEHSFGNALDIFSFRLNDGRTVTVKDGWRGSPEEQAFLREIFVGACDHFSTVLGPGADMFHYDHFHLDLARHNGGRHICKPAIKYTPRYDLPPPDPARPLRSAQVAPVPPASGRYAVASNQTRQNDVVPGITAFLEGQQPPRPSAPVGQGLPSNLPVRPLQTYQQGNPLSGGQFQNNQVARYNTPPPLPSQQRGPLMLPGSVPPTEEIIVGDDEEGVMDSAETSNDGWITPRNDPFAYRPKR